MELRRRSLVPVVHRGLRSRSIGTSLSVALGLLIAWPARESRLHAALLLLVGKGLLLDGRLLRANGALLAAAQSSRPAWIPWVGGLAFTLGATLILYALVFLGQPRAAP